MTWGNEAVASRPSTSVTMPKRVDAILGLEMSVRLKEWRTLAGAKQGRKSTERATVVTNERVSLRKE